MTKEEKQWVVGCQGRLQSRDVVTILWISRTLKRKPWELEDDLWRAHRDIEKVFE